MKVAMKNKDKEINVVSGCQQKEREEITLVVIITITTCSKSDTGDDKITNDNFGISPGSSFSLHKDIKDFSS